MNLVSYLLEYADRAAIALITPEGTYTYGEIIDASSTVGKSLLELGVSKGDCVGILADNSLFWIASYLGTIQIGAVAVPFPKTLEPARFSMTCRSIKCRAHMAQPQYLERYATVLPSDIPVFTDHIPTYLNSLSIDPILIQFESVACGIEPVNESRDLAALMFTSGSTGVPRAVMVSHRNVMANTESISSYLNLEANDRIMCVLPFYYCFGTSLLHTHLRRGASLVLSEFWPANIMLEELKRWECTGFAGVPSIFQVLLRNSNFTDQSYPHLRMIQQAGGKLAPAFIKEILDTFPETDLFIMYGQTEATARLAYLEPTMAAAKLGSIGRAIPSVRLRIIDSSGQEPGANRVGEIEAEGDNITLGYWNDPDATTQTFVDGKLRTGDLGYYDDDGYFYIVDRAKDFIKSRGIRFSSQEVEERVLTHPDVVEVAIIGEPHQLLGEAVILFVVLAQNSFLSERDIKVYCRQSGMPKYMIPKKVIFLSSLPKNEYGKVLKSALRKEFKQ